jgi:N4-gp56 family major capsid protein
MATAATNATTLTNTIKQYYDRVLLSVLDPTLKYYQFGEKRPLPKGEGMTMVWNRPTRLDKGFLLSEGVTTSTPNALSTSKVSAIIRQFGGYTSISDIVDLTSITDVMEMAAQRLGAQAGETIERVIVNELAIGNAGAGIHYVKNSASIGDYFESVSGVSVCSNGTAPGSVLGATGCYANTLAVSNVRTAIFRLKRLNVAPYEGNDYVAVINTETAEDIVSDSTWINFHQYAAPGQANLYTGEIGKIYGCRFVETTQGPAVRGVGDSLSTASAVMYGTLIMGKGYFGVTELDGGIKTFTSQGAEKSDPLNQLTTYGWKANFIAKVLNASCGVWFWAGSGDTTTVGDESASNSVVRYKYPTAY